MTSLLNYYNTGTVSIPASVTATGLYTETGNFAAGDTVTVGSLVYTFVTPIGSTPGNVLVGGTVALSLGYLAAAINNSGVGAGTNYVAQTVGANPSATAVATATTLALTAEPSLAAAVANAVATVYTPISSSEGAFGHTTLTGGVDSTAVVGVGTSWSAFIEPNDILWVNGVDCRIATVTDNADIVLAYKWPGPAITNSPYEIRMPPPSADVTTGLRAVVESLENGLIYAIETLTPVNGDVLQYLGSTWTVASLPSALAVTGFATGGVATPTVNFGGTSGLSAATSTGAVHASVNGVEIASFKSTGFGILSTAAAHSLVLTSSEALTADRILSIVMGDAARTLSLGGNITTAGAFATSGAYGLTLTQTALTNVTLPTTGTLATLAGAETLTNKTFNATNNTVSNLTTAMFATNVVDTDGTMAADSNTRVPSQAAVVSFVAAALQGIAWKSPVACVATANITLSGTQTIDGVAVVAGNRVLVTAQTTNTNNGIWIVASGSWTRSADASTGADIVMATTLSEGGTLYKGTVWTNNNTSITLGTTNITFVESGTLGSSVVAGTGLSFSGSTLNISNNGVAYAQFQQVAASSLVGNPTGSLANAQGITLGATLAFSSSVLETAAMTGDVTATANSFATTVAKIAGVSVGTPTGTGNVVFSASPTFSGTVTAPDSGTWSAANGVTATKLNINGASLIGSNVLTANGQSDVWFFAAAIGSSAQSGNFNNTIHILGGGTQSRAMRLSQTYSGNGVIDTDTNLNLMPSGGLVGIGM
ncbi:MAG: hypothetical protein RB191_20830, partial [Terriglobia bacterium]|nr:hypothetical protein [Terriglobia bacterium]